VSGWAQATLPVSATFSTVTAAGAGTMPTGFTQTGLGGYAGSLKFDTQGDFLVLNFAGAAGSLSFDIGPSNSFTTAIPATVVFDVQESSDGSTWTSLATYSNTASGSKTIASLNSASRYIRWIFTTKPSGTNVALKNISLAAGAIVTPAAPVVAPASANTTSGFTANWAASSGATKYYLDVATDSGVTVFVPNFSNLDVGNVTSYAVTGLGAGTTYYYKVRASNSAGTSASSGAQTALTTVAGTPSVIVSPASATGLTNYVGQVSASTNYTVTGANLGGTNLVVTASTNAIEVSTNSSTGFTNTFSLAPSVDGTLSNTVYVRVSSSAPVGAVNGTVSNVSGSASNNFTISGTVTKPALTLVLSPTTVQESAGAGASAGTVGIPFSLTNDLTVSLMSSNTAAATVPSTVTITNGQTNATFAIAAVANTNSYADATAVITASQANYTSANATLTVQNVNAAPVSTISLRNSGGGTDTQNFDALGTVSIAGAISGTVGAPTSLAAVTGSSTLNGWYATKIVGSATTATAITADNGNGNSGLVYNYGVTGATDRALGVLASGTSTMAIGALIKNDTGSIINSITVSFTAEFWRSSTTTQNVLTCAIGKVDGTTITSANFLTSAAATSLVALNITGPTPVTANGALIGNDAANRVAYSGVSIPLQLNPGETAFVRWQDKDDTGNDAGLAIDDLSLTYGVDSSVQITSFVASSGPVGTQVTINGANFTSGMPVKFNGIASQLVSFVSASQIVATVPEGVTTGYITVGDGAGAVVSATAFVVGDFAVTTPLDGMDFGSVSVGSIGGDKNLIIMGGGLPEGTLNIESDSPDFLLSEDGSTWSSSLSIAYDGSFATPYIRFAPLSTGAKTALVTLSSGGTTVAKYTFTGTGNSIQNVTGFAAVSGNAQIGLSWTNASPSTGVIILAQQGSAVTNSPVASNSYTASTVYGSGTQVGTSYVVFNSTGTNVTVTGLTNRLLYYFKAFNVSGDNVSSGASVSRVPYIALSNVITQWNFNGSTNTPSLGTGTAQAIGGTLVQSYTAGSPTDPLGTGGVGNFAWTLNTWTGGSTETAGVQFNVSTAGKGSIVVSWDAYPSNTGPKYYRLLYTSDGSVATPVWTPYTATGSGTESGLYVNPVGASWTIQNQADLSGVPALQNNPNAAFRLVSAHAPGTSAYAAAQSGSTAGSGGTLRLDMVTVSGVASVFNNPPTNITLSATTIAENNAVNAVVGTLSTTDADSSDTHTYSLVSGTGITDNASFNIAGASLRASAAFDFETKSSYSIRVRTTDSANNTFEKEFTITVTDVNETPADTTPPVITLIGANPLLIANGSTYADPGATVTDNVDATRTIQGTGTVNTAAAGDYTITYNATDAANNAGIRLTRTVRVAGTYVDWSGGSTLDSAGLAKYAIGGASSLTANDGVKPTTTLTGEFLVITAIVRTDNSRLAVVGQAVTDLANYASGTGVTTVNGVETTDQTGVPTGHKRKTFSVARDGDARKFMRLSASLALSGTNTTVSVARDSGGATFLQVTGATAGSTSGGSATSDKRTVYYFANDTTSSPTFSGTAWPYVIVQGQLSAGAGVTATLTKNSSGMLLVNGLPAYQFDGDSSSTTASGVSGAWPAMRADGTKTTTAPGGTIQ